jgi:hypothetical protein
LNVFIAIGNNLGTFLQLDESYQRMKSRTIAHILVERDLKEGLVEDIEIVVENR